MPTTYTGYDPTQNAFLSALALGETGKAGSGATYTGTGGSNLSSAPVDQYGFPQWSGVGNSHAAGTYQFQPGTWDAIAAKLGLNFGNPADQNAGAWYDAQQVYATKTGGDLETDLQAGKFSNIQAALANEFPSVLGNGANPGGLVSSLTSGAGANVGTGGTVSADTSGGASSGNFLSQATAFVGDEFSRFGVLIVGGLVVIVALWYLLSSTTSVPSPGQTAKLAGKALAVAA